jgi:predicted amidohydrolase YtcJ
LHRTKEKVLADGRTLLIHSATVLTMDPARELIRDGAVLVEDGRIAYVGPDRAHAAGCGGGDIAPWLSARYPLPAIPDAGIGAAFDP